MKKKRNKWIVLLIMVWITTAMLPVTTFAATRNAALKKVRLTKISAPAYNKIKIQWKKIKNATHYKIYYKKKGKRSWTQVATVSGKHRSYMHTSSKQHPIITGQKYIYTVKGYNSRSKKSGKCSKKGLTACTKPSTVKLKKAALSSDKSAVTVSWEKAEGCNYYFVFRKTPDTGWKRLAKVKSGHTSYTDKKPLRGQKNIYMVQSYCSRTKTYGNFNSKGVSVGVPDNRTGKKEKPKYSYEIKLMNPYDELYNIGAASPVFYIKTKNPDYRSIILYSEPDVNVTVALSGDAYDDVKGVQVGNWLKVSGGYLCRLSPEKAGTYKFHVREVKKEYVDSCYFIDGSLKYCYETDAVIKVQIMDYKKAGKQWIQSLIQKYTKADMSPKEKFEAIIYGEFFPGGESVERKYRYHAVKYDDSLGDYRYVSLLSEQGCIWQNHRLDSYTSPILMRDIGVLVGYDVKVITFDVSDPSHAYVEAPDGERYTICPMVETGNVGEIKPIDFSKY